MPSYGVSYIKSKCLPFGIKGSAPIKPIFRKGVTVIVKNLQLGIGNTRVRAVSGCPVVNAHEQIVAVQCAQINASLYAGRGGKAIATDLYRGRRTAILRIDVESVIAKWIISGIRWVYHIE